MGFFSNRNLPRYSEYKALVYRIGLAYVFYFLARALFFLYNRDLIDAGGFFGFLKLAYHGIAFDTTAILYVNALFIVFSILPLYINARKGWQVFLFYLYFAANLIAYATNFIDFIYYRYNFGRSTIAMTESVAHESNKWLLFMSFLVRYWHVFLLFFGLSFLWIFLYRKYKVVFSAIRNHVVYWMTSVAVLLVVAVMTVGGIRGDFRKSTRPINVLDASRYTTQSAQADVVLNTPFAIIRTMFSNSFQKVDLVSVQTIDSLVVPVKEYHNNPPSRPNIVIFILESNGKEYYGCLNKDMHIPDFQSYTPFVDSLATHSLIFTDAYSNGYKSIHAMSSILAGIPSFKDAFTSSPYPKQPTQSLVSVLKSLGYTTSFYHGAPNGSMGFMGYANILGIGSYYGKTEYNNDKDFDGVWGIWDEPFFQYFDRGLNKEKQPFMATIFSVSSHEPYHVPPQYEGKFPKGHVNIHQCIGYTDFALRKFFDKAKRQPWFNNTIFVLVGDHGNTIYYDAYKKEANKNSVAMLIYRPGGKYAGVYKDFAQQIDLYPTLLDMIGYDKPFRSWGRSLIGDKQVPPFVIRYSANTFQYFSGDYICTFDGKKAVGFYDQKNDRGLTHNLIGSRNAEMDEIELRCKAFIQDYMERVIDKRLTLN